MLRFAIVACLLTVNSSVKAQRPTWEPSDIASLTSVPWDAPGASVADVLQSIFREPDYEVRYPMLVEYLSVIPLDAMEDAYKICLIFEGRQEVDALVNPIFKIWARRDPEARRSSVREWVHRAVGCPVTMGPVGMVTRWTGRSARCASGRCGNRRR